MLIGSKSGFMVASGSSLPYDAEIEYLESTGTQWIDTGVVPNGRTALTCRCMRLNGSNFAPVFWSRGSSSTDRAYCFEGESLGGSQGRWDYAAFGALQIRGPFPAGVTIDVSVSDGVLVCNGYTFTRAVQDFIGAGTIILFNFCNYINGVRQMITAAVQPVRIYSLRLDNQRDFIPVRRGTVGYMYDKVTNRLFGNQGTGSFILGPDITSTVCVWGGGGGLTS